MKGVKALLIASGVGIIGYAIYRYYKKQVDLLANYTYKVVGIKIVTITTDNIVLDVNTRITNNSNVSATVTEIYLDAYLNGEAVANINEVKDILVKANGSSDFSFRLAISPKMVLGNIVNIVTLSAATKDLLLNLKGYVKIKSGFLSVSLPFEYQNQFLRYKPPRNPYQFLVLRRELGNAQIHVRLHAQMPFHLLRVFA
jgi:LEA14-like dessication related protein